jgi:hypothetical protein
MFDANADSARRSRQDPDEISDWLKHVFLAAGRYPFFLVGK